MLTPDRLALIENALRNIAFLLMAGMMEAFGTLAGDLSQALHDAFAGQEQKRDVAAEVRKQMSDEQSKMLESMISDAKPDSAIQARILEKLDPATADELIAKLNAPQVGLPPLTEPLPPEALLAYFQLLQDGNEELAAAVGEFSNTMQSLAAPQNRIELEQDGTGRLSSVIGQPVAVTIDKSCGEGTEASGALDEIVSGIQQVAWTDWKRTQLQAIDAVKLRNVKQVAKVGWKREGSALLVDVCLAEGSVGYVSSQQLSEGLDVVLLEAAQAALIAAREKRAITGPEGLKLEISGLRVTQPTPAAEEALRPFSWSGGTTVALTVRRPLGGLTSFNSEKASIRAAKDDHGKDLLIGDDPTRDASASFGSFPTFDETGTACLIELDLPGVPSPGSDRIAVDLDLAFEVANGVTETSVQVRFADGAHFKLGTIPFEVTSVEDDDWGYKVNLKTNKPLSDLAGFRFVAANGEEIPVTISSSSSMNWGDEPSEERQLSFASRAEKGKLIARMWKEKRVVTFPVTTEIGVGF